MPENPLPYVIVYTGFLPIIFLLVNNELKTDRRENMYSDKEIFEKIISEICMLYQNEKYKKEVEKLEKSFQKEGYKVHFGLIEDKDPELDIDFYNHRKNNKLIFIAQIDLTQGNSAPYTIIKWEETIERLICFIKENSDIISNKIKI